MKQKVCKWLDSNEWGAIRFEFNKIFACCSAGIELIPEKAYKNLTYDDIITSRKNLFKDINDGKNSICQNCAMLKNVDENQIDIGKIRTLIYLPYTTCNFRCQYCYLPKEQLAEKLDFDKANILPVIQNLKNIDVLTDDFELILGGGEPMLIKDIPEIVNFLSKNFKKPILKFLSNSSFIPDKEIFFNTMKNSKNITRKLYTSIDAGTPETYAKLRGNDCYKKVINNLMEFAKNNIYDEITLKFILMEDNCNLSDKDVFGFGLLCKKVSELNPNITNVCIDADFRDNKINADHISEKMLEAAGKIYYIVTKLLNLEVVWLGNRLCGTSKAALDDINSIKQYAENYSKMQKNKEEIRYLQNFKTKKLSLLQKFFSIRNEGNHKVIRILGFKIKIKRK